MTGIETNMETDKGSSIKGFTSLLVLVWLSFMILFLYSPLSKIHTIKVQGNTNVASSSVIVESELQIDDTFLFVGSATITERIKQIPRIKDVEIIRNFPGEVILRIKEWEHVAYVANKEDGLSVLLENGNAINEKNVVPVDRPIIHSLEDAKLMKKLSKELSTVNELVISNISDIKYDASNDLTELTLYMKDGYEVRTNIEGLAESIQWYPMYVETLESEGREKGILWLYANNGRYLSYDSQSGISVTDN